MSLVGLLFILEIVFAIVDYERKMSTYFTEDFRKRIRWNATARYLRTSRMVKIGDCGKNEQLEQRVQPRRMKG